MHFHHHNPLTRTSKDHKTEIERNRHYIDREQGGHVLRNHTYSEMKKTDPNCFIYTTDFLRLFLTIRTSLALYSMQYLKAGTNTSPYSRFIICLHSYFLVLSVTKKSILAKKHVGCIIFHVAEMKKRFPIRMFQHNAGGIDE